MRYWLLLLALVPAVAPAQGPNPAALAARAWRQQHERAIVDELVALLGIPNIARDRQNIERTSISHHRFRPLSSTGVEEGRV